MKTATEKLSNLIAECNDEHNGQFDFSYLSNNVSNVDCIRDVDLIIEESYLTNIEIINVGDADDYFNGASGALSYAQDLARDMGQTCESLFDTCLLAGIHASDYARQEWYQMRQEVEDFIYDYVNYGFKVHKALFESFDDAESEIYTIHTTTIEPFHLSETEFRDLEFTTNKNTFRDDEFIIEIGDGYRIVERVL